MTATDPQAEPPPRDQLHKAREEFCRLEYAIFLSRSTDPELNRQRREAYQRWLAACRRFQA
jgi:hypothetical protein